MKDAWVRYRIYIYDTKIGLRVKHVVRLVEPRQLGLFPGCTRPENFRRIRRNSAMAHSLPRATLDQPMCVTGLSCFFSFFFAFFSVLFFHFCLFKNFGIWKKMFGISKKKITNANKCSRIFKNIHNFLKNENFFNFDGLFLYFEKKN